MPWRELDDGSCVWDLELGRNYYLGTGLGSYVDAIYVGNSEGEHFFVGGEPGSFRRFSAGPVPRVGFECLDTDAGDPYVICRTLGSVPLGDATERIAERLVDLGHGF